MPPFAVALGNASLQLVTELCEKPCCVPNATSKGGFRFMDNRCRIGLGSGEEYSRLFSQQRAVRAEVWAKTNGRCWYCGKQTNPFHDFSVDHVEPEIEIETIENLVPCCLSCNTLKSNSTDIERLRYYLGRNKAAKVSYRTYLELKSQGLEIPVEKIVFYFEEINQLGVISNGNN